MSQPTWIEDVLSILPDLKEIDRLSDPTIFTLFYFSTVIKMAFPRPMAIQSEMINTRENPWSSKTARQMQTTTPTGTETPAPHMSMHLKTAH